MVIDIDLDNMLGNIDTSNIKVKTRGRQKKTTKVKTELGDIEESIIERQSNFKAPRHLVEYLIIKDPLIRFDKVEKLLKKEFPGHVFDTASFMWVKLDYSRNKHLEFGDLILEQIKKEKEKETK